MKECVVEDGQVLQEDTPGHLLRIWGSRGAQEEVTSELGTEELVGEGGRKGGAQGGERAKVTEVQLFRQQAPDLTFLRIHAATL